MSNRNKNKKSTNNSKDNTPKDLNELIINAAVEKYKAGEITNSLEVENFLDGLLQPLMQKLLDTELDNHLEYSKYEHSKNKKNKNIRNA